MGKIVDIEEEVRKDQVKMVRSMAWHGLRFKLPEAVDIIADSAMIIC